MDIASIKQKLTPYIDKATDAGKKALVFTEKQVQTTPIFLKTETEYHEHITGNKRAITIGYDENHEIAHTIRMMMPIWATMAWADTASLKYMGQTHSPGMLQTLKYNLPVEMRVWYGGQESFVFHDIASIEAWWKNRCYTTEAHVPSTSSTQTSTDLLQNI